MSEYLAEHAYTEREIAPGDVVRPWIAAGPFFHDVSDAIAGRSLFEDLESDSGEELLREYLTEAEKILAVNPREDEVVTFRGQSSAYQLIENEEPFVNWGTYFVGNHVVTQFLASGLRVEKSTTLRFRLHTRIDPQVAIAVNGRIQYRLYDRGFVRTNRSWEGEQAITLDLELQAGLNAVTILAMRMGRIACGAISLELVEGPVRVDAPVRPERNGQSRALRERARNLYYPAREWFYPHEAVRLRRLPGAGPVDGEIQCEVIVDGRAIRSVVAAMNREEIDLGRLEDSGASNFQIHTTVHRAAHRLEPRRFSCTLVSRTPSGAEMSYDERRRMALKHFAAADDSWAQVARYALGRPSEIDAAVIADGCRYIDRRLDCADFILHPFLRLIWMDHEKGAMDPQLTIQVTRSALGFRYWTDEPGSDSLVTGTENHQILFHSAEIIAGYLWPKEIFPNSGMTGEEHVQHGRELAFAWLESRLDSGFTEWHSSSYYPHWIAALVDLLDVVPEHEGRLRALAHSVLTMGLLAIATDSWEGALLTTHGRVYAPMLKVPDLDGCSGVHWLLFGEGNLNEPTAVVPLASGAARPPEIVNAIAQATDGVTLTRHHQGDARFIVYRTPDYLLSALQDYHPGARAAQVHPFQLTFRDNTAVFLSCPQTSNEGGGFRPDYWSGNGSLPRVFGERNVAVLLFRTGPAGWMSHCYFERDRFDELVERDGWLFARKGDGYIALWSENGFEVGTRGQYAGRELICRARTNAWVVEAGRRADCGEFAHFMNAIVPRMPRVDGETVAYRSPSVGTIRMGWNGPITLNGGAVDLNYPLLDGPHGYAERGSGTLLIRLGDNELKLP